MIARAIVTVVVVIVGAIVFDEASFDQGIAVAFAEAPGHATGEIDDITEAVRKFVPDRVGVSAVQYLFRKSGFICVRWDEGKLVCRQRIGMFPCASSWTAEYRVEGLATFSRASSSTVCL